MMWLTIIYLINLSVAIDDLGLIFIYVKYIKVVFLFYYHITKILLAIYLFY
jgi:hypothetical protein